MSEWSIGGPITGPSSPSTGGPCCGGRTWPHVYIGDSAMNTVAIVPAPEVRETARFVGSVERKPNTIAMHERAMLIQAAPDLLAALKAVEYAGTDSDCLICGMYPGAPTPHAPDCLVGNAIARAEGRAR